MSLFVMECAFFLLIMVYWSGSSVKSQTQPANVTEMDKDVNSIQPDNRLQELFGLLNRTVIQGLITDHSNITKGSLATDQLTQLLKLAEPLGKPNQSTSAILEEKFKETTNKVTEVALSSLEPEPTPGGSDISTTSSVPIQGVENSFNGTEFVSSSNTPTGQFFSPQPAQLIPSELPWPAGNNTSVTVTEVFSAELTGNSLPVEKTTRVPLQSRFKETAPTLAINMSPLEYHPNKPTFAGQFSSGQPSQLIPPGLPWPAGVETEQFVPPRKPWPVQETTQVSLEDRFKETTTNIVSGPLEYHPNKPTFAGQFSSGQPSQLVPPGLPWPADPPATKPSSLENRFQEFDTDRSRPSGSLPFFASSFSNGQPSQLIPPGKPWPADPPQFPVHFR